MYLLGMKRVGLLFSLWLLSAISCAVRASETPKLPEGVLNTQDPHDKPLPPEEAVRRITVPDGFSVSLFAGEPNVMQPIAFDFDDRGRLWVVECFSYPDFKNVNRDRIIILCVFPARHMYGRTSFHQGKCSRRQQFTARGSAKKKPHSGSRCRA